MKYIQNWTEFDGRGSSYNSGNFVAFKITSTEGTPQAQLVGAATPKGWQTDENGEFVYRITDQPNQSIQLRTINEDETSSVVTISLAGLTLESAPVEEPEEEEE